KDEFFGFSLFCYLQEHDYARPQSSYCPRSNCGFRRSRQLVYFGGCAGICSYLRWNGLGGISYSHDVRTLSRYNSNNHHMVDCTILRDTGNVEAQFSSNGIPCNHSIEPICSILGDSTQSALGTADQLLCLG